MSRRLGFVVEGRQDKLLFNALKDWFQKVGFHDPFIQVSRDRSRLIAHCDRYLQVARLKGCERILFFLDQDQDECPPATAARLQAVGSDPHATVFVMARALEAWLLADKDAIEIVTKQKVGSSVTDTIDDPKGYLKELFRRGQRKYPAETRMVRAIAAHFSLERAAQHNASAKRFLDKIVSL